MSRVITGLVVAVIVVLSSNWAHAGLNFAKKVDRTYFIVNPKILKSIKEAAAGRDADADGLIGSVEERLGTDPNDPDTDADGLYDGEEDANHNGIYEPELGETDPLRFDTDLDGLSDGDEVEIGSDPLNNDTDLDGLSDGYEVWIGSDPLNPDTDGDSIADGYENGDCIFDPDPACSV